MKRQSWTRLLLVASAAALVAVALAGTPPLRRIELWAGDHLRRLAAPDRSFPDTVVVVVDDASLTRLEPLVGAWPYPRDVFARATEYLAHAGARAIAFNILFSESRSGDADFAAALEAGAPVALAAVATPFELDDRPKGPRSLGVQGWRSEGPVPARRWRDVRLPLPDLARRAALGVVTMHPDEDGVVRRVPVLNAIDGLLLPSLPVAAGAAGGPSPPVVTAVSGRIQVGDNRWPVDANGEVELLFGAAPYRLTQVPFARLAEAALAGRDAAATRALFRGRTVFIGSTALLLGEVNETPMGRVPGVVLAAQAYTSLTHDLVLAPRAWWWTLLMLACALAPVVVIRRWRPDSLVGLAAASTAGLALSWGVALALLVWLRQPASVLTAWLAGATAYVAFLAEKIEALRLTRQQLTSERLAAERAAQLKNEFLAHVSHELRTPLTAILGFSRVLADEPALATDKRALVQIIHRNGEQLLWLVNNLLDQARIAAGQMGIEAKPTAVRDVIEQVLATLAGVPRRPGVELKWSCAAETPALVEVDGHRLQQILINLAANALRFTERGSVLVDVSWDRGWLDVAVHDTGPGMGADVLEDIFEAFNQGAASSSARRGGTGLGLTISRNLARLMGGDITVTSLVGHGSTFRLRVPAVRVEQAIEQRIATAATARDVAARTALAGAARAAPRALIADDSEDIRALLEIFLRRIGLETIGADNGRKALEIALAENPDVVVMDVEMAEMTGIEAVQAMRQAGFTRSVVALTAGSGDQLEHELLAAGFTAVAFKPISGADLANTVLRQLGPAAVGAARRGHHPGRRG